MLTEQLAKLEAYWMREDRFRDAVRPGLPPEAVASTLVAVGLEPHPEVIEWFGWHDGVNGWRERKSAGVGGTRRSPLALAEAVEWRDYLLTERSRLTEEVGAEVGFWEPGWFPLLVLANGTQSIGVDCGVDSDRLGQLIVAGDAWVDPFWMSGLSELVTRWLWFYETGGYAFRDGTWEAGLSAPTSDPLDVLIY